MPSPELRAARLFLAFLRLGATAFGGPATVAQMRVLVVARERWLLADEFDECLALSQVLPGATAMQCAACVGLRLCGVRGASASFLGFGLPAFLLMLALSAVYAHVLPIVAAQATLAGLRLAVIAVVAWAAVDFARAHVKAAADAFIAALATALLLLSCHPVLVVSVAALAGMLHIRPDESPPALPSPAAEPRAVLRRVGLSALAAVVVLGWLFLISPKLASLGLAMMKIDVVAFGGGFAALPLMHEEFVKSNAMLSATTLLDGIAFGQVTPGPVVVTATFIGYQIHGLSGAVVATAGIFFPSFALVIALAPWFKRLQRFPRFHAATRSASLAFVGLLVAVTFQFAQSVHWTMGSALLAVAALASLGFRIKTLFIVVACGILATLIGMP